MAAPSSQAADARPISFVLHDLAANAAPFEVPLVIRPEELTRTEPSRLAVHQVLGGDGAFADSFGPGVATVQIAGHTGWRGGQYDDGVALFERLHSSVFVRWHAARADAVRNGLDPNLVKLIFADSLDGFTWVVAPQSFVLKRSKSRPLLAQFSITLTRLADAVLEDGMRARTDAELSSRIKGSAGLDSLDQSIKEVRDFSVAVGKMAAAALAPIKAGLAKLAAATGEALRAARGYIAAGKAGLTVAANEAIGLARSMSQAACNVTATIAAIKSLPAQVRATFSQVAGAFRNAMCLLRNVFGGRSAYADFSSVYGASVCSSTSGGRPLSSFAVSGKSALDAIFPATNATTRVSREAGAALSALVSVDPLQGTSISALSPLVDAVNQGVAVASA